MARAFGDYADPAEVVRVLLHEESTDAPPARGRRSAAANCFFEMHFAVRLGSMLPKLLAVILDRKRR